MGITTISLGDDILKQARDSQINISKAAEDGIKKKMGLQDVSINISDKKCKCGKEAKYWLWPDELWVCNNCLSRMSKIL